MICVAAFSLLPLLPFALFTLLLALPFWGGAAAFLQFVGLLVALVWSSYLYFLAIRENNSFTGIQAFLAMFLPPGILAIGGGVVVLVAYFAIILA